MGLRIGDVVELKSGGERVTVTAINMVVVEWLNDQGEMDCDVFPEDSLVKVDEGE